MEMTQNGYSLVIGIDVSKAKLDIAWGPNGPLETIENTNAEIARLLIKKIEDPANTLIVMEATGGYESGLVDLLHKSKLSLAVVNPRRVRDFAKGIGLDAIALDCPAREGFWFSGTTNICGRLSRSCESCDTLLFSR